ncbi:MAG: sensor histidine kinase [Vicinamibacteraceae bacterium]
MISSLQTRLLLASGLLALAAVAAVALSARQWTRHEFRRFQERAQHQPLDRATTTSAEAARALDGRCCPSGSMNRAAALLGPHEAIIVIDDDDGGFVAAAGPGATDLRNIRTRTTGSMLNVDAIRMRGDRPVHLTLELRGRPAARIAMSDGRAAHVHVISVPRLGVIEPAAAFLGSVDRLLLVATSIVGALALGATWAIARRIVRPIDELRDAARDLARGNLSRRVDIRGSDEVGELARSFNTMAAELERQHVLRRHFMHDVAHELRTPLTALQCRLETMLDGLAADPRTTLGGATEEVRHLSRLVEDLQEIAIAEARELKLSIGDVSIADVARSAARAAGLEADSRLRLDVDARLTARADAVRVRQVLLNLLTNADRHTPPDGEITVCGSHAGRDVVIAVQNTGSSLTQEQLARVFDRFYRADPARQRETGGTGLGLAIAKHLIEAQGGWINAACDAAGVTISFGLPAMMGEPR